MEAFFPACPLLFIPARRRRRKDDEGKEGKNCIEQTDKNDWIRARSTSDSDREREEKRKYGSNETSS